MPEAILGISAFYHDSAAAIIVDGDIVAAAQEERFTRKKHDAGFPAHAVKYVLDEAGVDPSSLVAVVFYDKPFIKFERLLETYHAFAPRGLASFARAIPVWIKEKLFMKDLLRKELRAAGVPPKVRLLFPEHHLSHAASAFYPSPFEEAAILTIDGVGEWATTTISHGKGKNIRLISELHFPHSLGLLYSAFTYYCGFRVNSGEYKLMGLAPYGSPGSARVEEFKQKILNELIDLRDDGSLLLNMRFFNFATGLRMTHDKRWKALFGVSRREAEAPLTQEYMDMALAIQQVTDTIVLRLAKTARELTGCQNLVMAGGVALNCVSNGKILESGLFDDIWIQPAAGDAGGSLGGALAAWHIYLGKDRVVHKVDQMKGAYLGPSYPDDVVKKIINRYGMPHEHFGSYNELAAKVARLISEGKVIGWFQGRMEFGPRALGNRSILGDARDVGMQRKMNLKIKYRESFRPFAPSMLEEETGEVCAYPARSPYMLLVMPVAEKYRLGRQEAGNQDDIMDRLYAERSLLPAITHVDFSARVQTVRESTNPRYYKLIHEFKKITGVGVVINTSFNVRGEPIVCTPSDAMRCFMNTEIDYLVINDYLFEKEKVAHLKKMFEQGYSFALD